MNADDRGELARDTKVQVRILGRERFKLVLFALRHAASLVLEDEVCAADEHCFLVHHARNAVRHDVLDLRVILLVRQSAVPGLGHDGVGDGVGIVLFEARGKAEHFTLLVVAEGDDLRNLGRGVGERAGFVEDDGVRLGDGFEEAPALDGDVMAAALAHGREHRDRHGELERAGEVDHQHGQHLCDVARDEIGQDRAAERIGYEPVGKARGLVLSRGFELFRLFDHAHDAVIAAAAERLFHAHDTLALFGDRACVDIAALALGDGHGLARHGRLIDHRLAGDDLAVERDEAAGADNDAVARLNIADGNERFRLARLEPDVVNVERHRAREVRDGLFMRPVLEDFAEAEHEHHGACRREVAAHHRHGDGGGVEHGDGELAVQQCGKTLADVLDRVIDGERRDDGEREEELRDHAADHRPREFVFKFTVEFARRMVGDKVHCFGLVERERRERVHERGAVRAVNDHGVLRAVKDRDLSHAVHIAQIIFQNVRLMQRHVAAIQMHAYAPGGFVQNFAFHSVSIPPKVKESRASRLSCDLFLVRFFLGRVLNDFGVLFRCAALVDVLGIGVDVLSILTDVRDGLHHAVLGTQHRGGGVRVDLFGILAGKDLEAGGAEQHTCCK